MSDLRELLNQHAAACERNRDSDAHDIEEKIARLFSEESRKFTEERKTREAIQADFEREVKYAETLATEVFHQTIKAVMDLWPGDVSRDQVNGIVHAMQKRHGDAVRQARTIVALAKSEITQMRTEPMNEHPPHQTVYDATTPERPLAVTSVDCDCPAWLAVDCDSKTCPRKLNPLFTPEPK